MVTNNSLLNGMDSTRFIESVHEILIFSPVLRYDFIKQTIVYINARTITIVCPNKCLYMEQDNSTLKGLVEAEINASMTFFRYVKLFFVCDSLERPF